MINVIRVYIDRLLPLVSGVSQRGTEWKKQEYVGIVSDGPKQRTVLFQVRNEAIDTLNIQQGGTYDVSIDIESRSFNTKDGRTVWFTDVTAWKAELVDASLMQQPQQQPIQAQPQPTMPQQPQTQFNPPVSPQQMNVPTSPTMAAPQPTMQPQPFPTDDLPF